MLGKGDLWAGVGLISTLIVGGLGAIMGLMLYFQDDASDRFDQIDQRQLEQTERLGELNGALRYVEAVDDRRVEGVLTTLGHDPRAHDAQRAHVYLTRAGATDNALIDMSNASADDLTPMVSTYLVGDEEMRCVELQRQNERSAFLCAPRARAAEQVKHRD